MSLDEMMGQSLERTKEGRITMFDTPQFKMRQQYTVLYVQRFPHLGYEGAVSKGFATADREIGRGDWEIPMPEKPEPKLVQVRADIGEYVGAASGMCLRVREMNGNAIGQKNGELIRNLEHIYWKRVKWKYMTIPFVNYILKQAGFRR